MNHLERPRSREERGLEKVGEYQSENNTLGNRWQRGGFRKTLSRKLGDSDEVIYEGGIENAQTLIVWSGKRTGQKGPDRILLWIASGKDKNREGAL